MSYRFGTVFLLILFLFAAGCIHGKKSGPEEITITTTELPDGEVGVSYSAELKATRKTKGVDLTWSLESGSLPDGLTLSESGLITGVPTTAGTSSFVVKVVDNYDGSTDTQDLNIRIVTSGAGTLEITTDQSDIPDMTVGNSYAIELQANRTGGLEWTLEAGTLPHGLQLQDDGYILGVPTTPSNYAFIIRVTDLDTGETATKEFTIIVHNFNIYPDTLPNGRAGETYTCTLLTDGGFTPITWTVSSGVLPDGLELDPSGIIVGTPSEAVTSVFVITATDANNNSVSRAYTLTIQ